MNPNTEPLIAVIGQPMAGNPSQFAIESALKSLDLEYRVISFDVTSDDLETALSGLEVLGFRGVLVDDTLASEVALWWQKRSEECSVGAPIHCLFRDPDRQMQFAARNTKFDWLVTACENHFAKHQSAVEEILWLGARDDFFPIELPADREVMLSTRTPSIESVQQANLIVLAPGPKKDVQLDAHEWPRDDGSTLVVDLTDRHHELSEVSKQGYTTLTHRAGQTGIIQQGLLRWSGQLASEVVIHEAIEEYLGV